MNAPGACSLLYIDCIWIIFPQDQVRRRVLYDSAGQELVYTFDVARRQVPRTEPSACANTPCGARYTGNKAT